MPNPLLSLGASSRGVRSFDSASRAQARTKGKHAGPHTEVRVELSGLVSRGVYSLFYATFGPVSRHPLCPAAEQALPLASRHRDQAPDPSSFVADAAGRAVFRARADGRLLDATQVLYSVVYRFAVLTSHPLPNRGEHVTQGDDAMRRLTVWQKL